MNTITIDNNTYVHTNISMRKNVSEISADA